MLQVTKYISGWQGEYQSKENKTVFLNYLKADQEVDTIWSEMQINTSIYHNRAQKAHVNAAEPVTYPKDPTICEEMQGMWLDESP